MTDLERAKEIVDPLTEVLRDLLCEPEPFATMLREALAKRGLAVRHLITQGEGEKR